jgi:hypothetical protein
MNLGFRDKWTIKAHNVGRFLDEIGKPIEILVPRYAGTRFVDGVDREQVFSEVLSGRPSQGVVDYLNLRCTDGFGHFRGDRSGAEYAADLIISWIQEDALLSTLEDLGLSIELDGTDRKREFLPGTKVSSTSDFVLATDKKARKLEVAYDSTGHWRRFHKFDLRDAKFQRLLAEKSLLLGIDVLAVEGFVLDFSKKLDLKVQDIPFHFTYKKPAKSINGIDKLLVSISDALTDLKSLL